jgi:predicted ester cyclase
VCRLVEEGVNGGNLDVVDAVVARTYPSLTAGSSGVQSLKDLLTLYRGAVPDAHWTIDDQIAEGNTVVTCFTARGTHRGALWGLPPTGRHTSVPGILISRCAGGRIVAQWTQVDLLDLLQQLGVMPPIELDQAVVVAQVLRSAAAWTRGRREGTAMDSRQ